MLEYLEAAPTSSEPWIWTPGALQDRAKRLHSDILVFNDDLSAAKDKGKIPDGQLMAWRAYRDGWAGWFDNASPSTWLWSATASVLQDYENKLSAWRDWYSVNIGAPSGVGPSQIIGPSIKLDTSGKQDLSYDWTPVWWGVGALGVLGLGTWWFLKR